MAVGRRCAATVALSLFVFLTSQVGAAQEESGPAGGNKTKHSEKVHKEPDREPVPQRKPVPDRESEHDRREPVPQRPPKPLHPESTDGQPQAVASLPPTQPRPTLQSEVTLLSIDRSQSEDARAQEAIDAEKAVGARTMDAMHKLQELNPQQLLDLAKFESFLKQASPADLKVSKAEQAVSALEQFGQQTSSNSVANFDTDQAYQLITEALAEGSEVEKATKEQAQSIRTMLWDVKDSAMDTIKSLSREAIQAGKAWRIADDKAANAARRAGRPEAAVEGHFDQVNDAVGDAQDQVEDMGERLAEAVQNNVEKLRASLEARSDALVISGRTLSQRAEAAEAKVMKTVSDLNLEPAFEFAKAKAAFDGANTRFVNVQESPTAASLASAGAAASFVSPALAAAAAAAAASCFAILGLIAVLGVSRKGFFGHARHVEVPPPLLG